METNTSPIGGAALLNTETAEPLNSLSQIKARLQERKTRDVSKLPRHEHEALGVVCIGFLSTEGYCAVEAADAPDPAVDAWPPETRQSFREGKRARAYLKYGVLTGDNQRLDDETIELLLKGDFGAENKKLINAIQKANPPRAELTQEHIVMLGFDRMAVTLFRLLTRAGVLTLARDYLLAQTGSEESATAAAELQKWEEALPVFEAFLEVEATAKAFGIDVYERMKAEAQNSDE